MNVFNIKSFLNEASVLDVTEFVKWKRETGAYNFEKLPKIAVLTLFSRKGSWFGQIKRTKLKGLNGNNFKVKNSNYMVCEGPRSGGAEVINLCEELRALGVEQFIFLGLAGSIDPQIQAGELFYVSDVWSGSGLSYYYDANENIIPKRQTLIQKINTNKDGLNAREASVWSTDAPFRETKSLIEYYRDKGARLVEMECAGIYAFANFYQLEAACFVISSDQLIPQWSPPKNIKGIMKKGQNTIIDILKIIE